MMSKHTRKLKPGYQRWITKHASHNCGVGTTLVEWNQQNDDRCPRCSHPEDTTHVLRCTGSGATEVWNEHYTALEEWMTETDTHPLLQEVLLQNLQRWRQGLAPITQHPVPKIQQFLVSQATIGWRNLMEGLPSYWIRKIQQSHISSTQLWSSGKKWTQTFLSKVFHLARSQWEHRNDVKHRSKRPRHHAMLRQLNDSITDELLTGAMALPLADRFHFDHNLMNLLRMSTQYKKDWLLNVRAARERYARRLAQDAVVQAESMATSKLLKWMATGRAY